MIYILLFFILTSIELFYFKVADKYNIVDKPNHRSSHSIITIRGGGIVFPMAIILWFLFFRFQYPLVVSGLFLIALISFIDDLKDISRSIRVLIHLIAVSLSFWVVNIYHFNFLIVILSYILVIGIINAYNFMDGINGITGIYSLVLFLSLLLINCYYLHFVDNSLLITLIIAVAIFNFFNVRKKAKCFAGDIGSISLAFIISFLLLKLIVQTNQLIYILLLAVYGIDAVFTILIRLFKRENIFKPHRLHLYQLLANERKLPHVVVSILYGVIQLVFNALLIYFTLILNKPLYVLITFTFFVFLYIIIRFFAVQYNVENDRHSKLV